MQCHCPAALQLVDELRNNFLGVLVRAIYVVAAGDNNRQVERTVVALDEELGTGLGRRVGVGRLQNVLLFHWVLRLAAFTIHLVCANMDKPLDAVDLGRLEQDVSTEYVVLCELKRIAERVVHVCLRGEVNDRIDLLLGQHIVDHVRRTNVALDKLIIRLIFDGIKVAQARAIVELIEIDDFEVWIFPHQKHNRVASDESGAARDEHIFWRIVVRRCLHRGRHGERRDTSSSGEW
mmetsp:Transcript_9312/g.23414  ORF Transcript_9312/g.23414 Transcript_9312/m.23414 type:complete len:235 (+) Transcript_9312:909-1613(+)